MTNLTHPWNISSQYCCCCCITLAMSDSVQPHRRQPTRLCRPWDSPGKNTGVGCHFLPHCMKVKSESEVAQSCPSRATPLTAAHQAPPSMGFSRQEHWSWGPLPSLRSPEGMANWTTGFKDPRVITSCTSQAMICLGPGYLSL